MRRLFEELRHTNDQLARELTRISEQAEDVWRSQHLREFTVHGSSHFLQVEANLDALTTNLQRTVQKLSPEEIFVLIAACHLHDIGMQLGVTDARQRHAEYAYDLILYSSAQIGPDQRRVTLPISNPNARLAIAKVARGHWTDFALRLPEEDYIYENVRGRLRLLAVLLATGDLLDTSAIRAGYFRSDHRLFDLNPVSELHQTLHNMVSGYQIKPESSSIADKLVFELEWRDHSELVQEISDWLLRWFSSQIRQTAPELERLSGGAVRWASPWAQIVFRTPEGPMPILSDTATGVLKADIAAQRRIDRDGFVKEFQDAIASASSVMFVLPFSSETDSRQIVEWCRAQVLNPGEYLFGQIDIALGAPLELASLIASLLEQWDCHLPVCTNEMALDRLKEVLEENKKRNTILLAVADKYSRDLVQPVLEVYFGAVKPVACRVCVLVCGANELIPSFPAVTTRYIDLSSFSAGDLEGYLGRFGYDAQVRASLVGKMAHLGLLSSPGRVYTYLEDHCDRQSWRSTITD